jgi:CubicO group peptidase (beta-lactamase class C family)
VQAIRRSILLPLLLSFVGSTTAQDGSGPAARLTQSQAIAALKARLATEVADDVPPPEAPDALRAAVDFLPYRGTSAGGGYSTTSDLLKFANALTHGNLLNAELTALVSTGQVETSRQGLMYGFGFEDETLADGVRRFGHGGGAPGINALLSILPSSEYLVIVLANRDPPVAQEIARFICALLPVAP